MREGPRVRESADSGMERRQEVIGPIAANAANVIR